MIWWVEVGIGSAQKSSHSGGKIVWGLQSPVCLARHWDTWVWDSPGCHRGVWRWAGTGGPSHAYGWHGTPHAHCACCSSAHLHMKHPMNCLQQGSCCQQVDTLVKLRSPSVRVCYLGQAQDVLWRSRRAGKAIALDSCWRCQARR